MITIEHFANLLDSFNAMTCEEYQTCRECPIGSETCAALNVIVAQRRNVREVTK